jgi:hypothetical protein
LPSAAEALTVASEEAARAWVDDVRTSVQSAIGADDYTLALKLANELVVNLNEDARQTPAFRDARELQASCDFLAALAVKAGERE